MIKVKFIRGMRKREVEELNAQTFCEGINHGMNVVFDDFHKKIKALEANGESITFENLKSWYPEVKR